MLLQAGTSDATGTSMYSEFKMKVCSLESKTKQQYIGLY